MQYNPKLSDIFSISAFKANAAQLLDAQLTHKRPYVITQNGRSAGVVVSPEVYDSLLEDLEFLKSLLRGIQDADAGRTRSTEQLREELGLPK